MVDAEENDYDLSYSSDMLLTEAEEAELLMEEIYEVNVNPYSDM